MRVRKEFLDRNRTSYIMNFCPMILVSACFVITRIIWLQWLIWAILFKNNLLFLIIAKNSLAQFWPIFWLSVQGGCHFKNILERAISTQFWDSTTSKFWSLYHKNYLHTSFSVFNWKRTYFAHICCTMFENLHFIYTISIYILNRRGNFLCFVWQTI